jgi:ATP-dependent RNA helicase DHX37/DHR1
MPIEGVVLQMKSMNIDAVVNFPFPTPPDRQTLRKAETVLTHLGALACPATLSGSRNQGGQVLTDATVGGKITDLGRSMSLFPLSPRFSRMLVSGHQHGCLPHVISIVSALSVGDPFLREDHVDEDGGHDKDMPDKLVHLSSEAVKAKEARQLRRKMYFQAKQVHVRCRSLTFD